MPSALYRRPFVAAALIVGVLLASMSPATAAPWLFISDIHFNLNTTDPTPSRYGADTNLALLRSSIAEMQRVDPRPPVVVISGDFLGHNFDSSRAEATMILLARRFNAAFPQAQFVMALGNEDSGCGDYALSARAPFLHAVALAWAPLVNRHAAAPSFVQTFSRDGFYMTSLPIAHLEAAVIDDVFWSPRYRAACGGTSAADATFADLRRALNHHRGDAKWVIMHIPPGIDAFSTAHLVHHLVDVPFLNAGPRDGFLALVSDERLHVTAVLAAHTHKFGYRIADSNVRRPVPILMIPSISPIFDNAPAFLTVDVASDGIIERADDHALLDGRWQTIGGTRTLGLRAVSGSDLVALQARLARDPTLRRRYARLYNSGAAPEIDERNWPNYACAATAFASNAYRACLGRNGGISFLTRRGVWVVAIGVILLGAAIAGGGVLLYLRRSPRS